jgi:hypothetical protein
MALKPRDIAIALSLANLCLFSLWSDLLPGSPNHYFLKVPPGREILPFAVGLVTLLALVFALGVAAARRLHRPPVLNIARCAFLLTCLVAANSIRRELHFSLTFASGLGNIGALILAAAAVLLLARYLHPIARGLALVLLVLFPFVLLTFARATWSLVAYDRVFEAFRDKPLAPRLAAGAPLSSRVVWLLFDELDQRIAFLDRPTTIALPEFDRFASEALVATNAYPPARWTLESLPALITGKLISDVRAVGAEDLRLSFTDGGPAIEWSKIPNVFSEARKAGVDTAVVGIYHPYCRVLAGSLTTCSWQAVRCSSTALEAGLVQAMRLANSLPLPSRTPLLQRFGQTIRSRAIARQRKYAIGRYQRVLEDATEALRDPELGLILVHLPVPHYPTIYDRVQQKFVHEAPTTYLDNLVLADRTLGEIRRVMEEVGAWNTTAVLVTSDHPFRRANWGEADEDGAEEKEDARILPLPRDYRIPFLLKLAGQHTATPYEPPFNTIVTHDLILALLRGELTSAAGLRRWLDEHRSVVYGIYGADHRPPDI